MVNEGGVVTCVETNSEKNDGTRQVWKGRIGGKHWASPLYADGKIYFFSMEGRVTVISAGQEFKVLARNEFDNGFIATAAVAGNSLILRSESHLYCIEGVE